MSDKEFVIPFVGLKLGVHEFNFEITDAFFENIEYSLVQKGKVHVKLSLDKKETMLVGAYTLSGVVEAACARCTEPVDAEIEGEYQLIYKFDDKPSDDESLVIVYPEEFEIDVKENILELISVSLPSRTVHEEGECNEEMIDILGEYQVFEQSDSDELEDEGFDDDEEMGDDDNNDDDDIDPRWAALKGLKRN